MKKLLLLLNSLFNRNLRSIWAFILLLALVGLAGQSRAQVWFITTAGDVSTTNTDDALLRINYDGSSSTTIASSVAFSPTQSALDIPNNRIFVYDAAASTRTIKVLNASTGALISSFAVIAGISNVNALEYDPINDYIYYLTTDGSALSTTSTDALVRVKPDGTGTTVIATSFTPSPLYLALDIPNNRAFVYDGLTAQRVIKTINLSDGTTTQTAAVNTGTVKDIAYDPASAYLYYLTSDDIALNSGATDALIKVKPDGTGTTVISSPVTGSPVLFALDAGNNRAFVYEGSTANKAIKSVNLSSGVVNNVISLNTYSSLRVLTSINAPLAPVVTTTAATSVISTSATLGGNVTRSEVSVTERGVVYSSSNTTPIIGGSGVTQASNGSGTGAFSASVPGLTASTTYFARAYATSGAGTSYGSVTSFTTLSADANLAGLSVSAGTLNPNFAAATTSYTVSVPNATTSVTITPTQADANATIKVNNTGVSPGTASGAISLNEGANTITTIVTAQDGTTTKTYTLTVNRAPSADLSVTLSTSPEPVNDDAILTYTAKVTNAGPGTAKSTVLETTIPATLGTNYFIFDSVPAGWSSIQGSSGNLTFTNYSSEGLASGGSATFIYKVNTTAAAVGDVVTTATVSSPTFDPVAGNNTATATTTVISTNPDLSAISLSEGTLNPEFSSSTLSYTATVASETTSITITPTAVYSGSTITVNGATVASGTASEAIALNPGENSIPTIVTAQDGVTTKTYTTIVTRFVPPSNVAGLGITLNAGTPLVQTSGPANVNLSSTVAYSVSSIRVKAYVLEAHATISLNGVPQPNNVFSDPIALSVGTNIINVIGTAQDGVTTRNYRITVTRTEAPVNIADVNIALNPNITLATTTGSADFNYAATVANAISDITLTPTATSPVATIKLNGATVATGTANPIALNTGANTIDVLGTSQDGTVTKSYRITITRGLPGSNVAGLGITLNGSTPLVQVSGPADVNFTSMVPYSASSIKVKAYVLETHATITVNGTPQANNVLSNPIALNVGDNVINVVGTAQDGITTRTYRLTVTRGTPPVDIADLSIAAGPNITLANTSGSADFNYTATVANPISSVVITPTAASPLATIKLNGATVASGSANSVALNAGSNTIDVVGTSQDGTVTKSYRITVIRGLPGSSIAGLGITLSAGTPLVQVSGPANVNTTSTVVNGIASISVKAYVLEPNATITLNGAPLASNVLSGPIALNVGDNVINVVGTAQDAITTRSYRITVTRSAPVANQADLMIALTPNTPLTLVSGSSNFNYTGAVANSVTSVRVIPTAASTTATITVNGHAVATGTPSNPIALNTGTNILFIVGASQDGTAIKTYRITLTRAQPGSNIAGLGITLSEGTKLVQVKGPANVNLTSTVANSVTSVRVKAYVLEPNATITLNGAPQASNVLSDPIALNVGDNIIDVVGTAQDQTTKRTYRVTVTRSPQTLFAFNPHDPGKFSNVKENMNIADSNDGVVVHQGVSPNGDGMNDFLTIEGVSAYKDNKLSIMNANGSLVYETKDYGGNGTNLFDGHSNKNGSLLKPGTYFYSLEYQVDKESKRKTGFVILKY